MSKKIFKTLLILGALIMLLFFSFSFVSAQDEEVPEEVFKREIDYPEIFGEKEPTTLPQYIRYIYIFAAGSGGFLAVLMLIIGSIQLITSAGNPKLIADAKGKILGAISGLLLIFCSYLIISIINPDLLRIRELDVPEAAYDENEFANLVDEKRKEILEMYTEYSSEIGSGEEGGEDAGKSLADEGFSTEDIPTENNEPHKASLLWVYNSDHYFKHFPTLEEDKDTDEPCEIHGTWDGGKAYNHLGGPKCGSYCMGVCKRLFKNEPYAPYVYGILKYRDSEIEKTMKWAGADGDRIDCECYKSNNKKWSGAATFTEPGDYFCHIGGSKEYYIKVYRGGYRQRRDGGIPRCFSGKRNLCNDWCREVKKYSMGYLSAITGWQRVKSEGVYCTCLK